MDSISNPKTNPSMHEGLMVVLYNHIKNTTVQLNIVEVSDSNEELDESDDDDGEGYDIEVEVEDDPHIPGWSKQKMKTGQEDQGKGSVRRKQKEEDDDNLYEEEDETDDDMETDSEDVQILSSQKHKGKNLRSEDLGSKSCLPFSNVSKEKGLVGEDTPMKEAKNAELKEVGLEVNFDPVRDKAHDGSHLDIDLYFKNGTNYFNKVFLWVQKEITSIKEKKIQEASKIKTLEAIGTGKFSSLLDYLSNLTKAISNAEEIINAQCNSFQILGKTKLGKLESDQGEKAVKDNTEVKEDTPEDKENDHGRRTHTSTKKKQIQSREIEEIKQTTENMEQLELEATELLKNFT
ncbi:uncharacterized protein LOC131875780 [Cryptomeria japonica]|uniref:uncharacterized protein LOC131875780 n=1 Tax=Cryptomeria japonica TaxID=3369 RepID=UPI0027DA729F|nr:uncharacterized protein LOC131875780 [Cryptomeria japonica]